MPFGVVRMPARGGLNTNLLAVWGEGCGDGCDISVRVKPWLAKNWLELSAADDSDVPPMAVCPESTPHDVYTRTVAYVVRQLKRRGGKTVIARNICGRFAAVDDAWGICKLIERYFSEVAPATTLTFVFLHPATGFWMGSTPELIMEYNSGELSTMALAGTLPAESTASWDSKNIVEHEIVADYMARRLGRSGISFERGGRADLIAGSVRHLCTRFKAAMQEPLPRRDFDALVETIQPTPALAGYPRREAIDEIHMLELWHRYYYSGLINIADISNNLTYGLIRCVHFDLERWCIYTGSGITADSDPEKEWAETTDKARPLAEMLRAVSLLIS